MAHNYGISTVYQELIQFPDMTIMGKYIYRTISKEKWAGRFC